MGDPIVPTISVVDVNDNLGADGEANEDAAPANNGIIPGTNMTMSLLIIAGAGLLFLAFSVLCFAYMYDRSKKAGKMREVERNISNGYGGHGMQMISPQSPSLSG